MPFRCLRSCNTWEKLPEFLNLLSNVIQTGVIYLEEFFFFFFFFLGGGGGNGGERNTDQCQHIMGFFS